jgi:hypothetical protein
VGDRKFAAGDSRAREEDWRGPLVSVAYVVTSYHYPEQVLRLARTLRAGSPDAPLLIHHDNRRSQLDVAALAGLGDVQLVRPPTAVTWGWASHLDMLLRCFTWALERVPFDCWSCSRARTTRSDRRQRSSATSQGRRARPAMRHTILTGAPLPTRHRLAHPIQTRRPSRGERRGEET